MRLARLVVVCGLLASVWALHDGRFVHADPWRPVRLLDEVKEGVLWDILPQLLFFGLLATGVCLVNQLQTVLYVGLPSTMLTVLGTVIGFTVSYRTSSAYGRFLEGAHLWGETIATCRQLARLIWVHVPGYVHVPKEGEGTSESDRLRVLLEKKTMLNLLEAYAVALKHYLRGESGVYYEDLYHLTCMLPKYSMPTSVPIARRDLEAPHHPHLGRHIVHSKSSLFDPLITLHPATPTHQRGASPRQIMHAQTTPPPIAHAGTQHGHHHRHAHHRGAEAISAPVSATSNEAHIPSKEELRAHQRGRLTEMGDEAIKDVGEKFEKVVGDVEESLTSAVDILLHPDHARDPARALMRVNTAPINMQSHRTPPQRQPSESIETTSPAPPYTIQQTPERGFPTPLRGRSLDRSPPTHVHRSRSASSLDPRTTRASEPKATKPSFRASSLHGRTGSIHSRQSGVSSGSQHAHSEFHGPRNPPFPLMPARNPPRFSIIQDLFPFLAPFKQAWLWATRRFEGEARTMRRRHKQNLRKKRGESDNLPLELIIHFSSYTAGLQRRKILDVPTTNALLNSISALQMQLTSLEKILSTPIPLAYQLHLKHATLIYLCFLPFQLEPILGYNSIPAVLISCFMFLGFLEIGQAIESPFGYDRNDLDLDEYCQQIVAKEIKEISAHPPLDPSDFIFLHSNEPLAPADRRSALELLESGASVIECEKALLKGHERDRGWRSLQAKMGGVPSRSTSLDV